jgi:hypothetical protein
MSHNQIIGCGFVARHAFFMAEELKCYKRTQREQKEMDECDEKRKRKRLAAQATAGVMESESDDNLRNVLMPRTA